MPLTTPRPPSPRRLAVGLFSALTIVMLVIGGCKSDVEDLLRALGEGCLINSDCDEDLVCVFRRCHRECESTADCPLSATGERLRCVVGEHPSHVCQLDDERACSYSSQCPATQICGPDGQCRDQCEADRDCLGDQVCTQTVCAELEELSPDNPFLPVSTPPEEQETGLPCEYNNQCEGQAPEGGPPFVCRDGICAYDCFLDIDCSPNTICSPQDDDPTTAGLCVPGTDAGPIHCVPGAQVVCECPGGLPDDGYQICQPDGLSYGPCKAEDGMDCPAAP
jgi:hypothetical protein